MSQERHELIWGTIISLLVVALSWYFYHQYQLQLGSVSLPQGLADSSGPTVSLTVQEVAKHNIPSDCWLIVQGKVYNVSSLINTHSGGPGAITPYCGQDSTNVFLTKGGQGAHSQRAVGILASYELGPLNGTLGTNKIIQTKNVLSQGGEREDD